ncbi:MAG: LamG domain-containing protein [Sedimentisphaerales bacterium]|nr:LamG domain-containing protein [Sedimentisphaerales bacterium]
MKKKKLLLALLLATTLIAGTAGAQDITTGLMGHWKLDDGSGDAAIDSSPNGNDGTLVNGPVWAAGPPGFGGALDFDGLNDYVDCGTFVPTTDGTLSLCAWVYQAGQNKSTIVAKRTDWAGTSFDMMIRNTNSLMIVRSSASGVNNWCNFDEEVKVPVNEWTHVVITVDGTENADSAKAYMNGELIKTAIWVFQCPVPDAPVLIGASQTDPIELFGGLIDDVRIYNRTLSEDDIFELMITDPDYNYTPRVDAGDYQSLLWPDNSVQLDATASDDGRPYQDPPADPCTPVGLTLTWSKLSGPGTVDFSDTTIEDPTATFGAVGFYELRLRGYDGEKDACDVVSIYVRSANNMVAHWDFETGSSTNVVDRTTNDNFGTFAGDPEPNWVAGWVGTWALDVANNSYVAITADPAADPNLDTMEYEVSVATWVKVDSWGAGSWNGIVTKGDGGAGGPGGWSLIRNELSDSLTFFAPDAGRVDGSVIVKDGYWHHVVGVHNGVTISLYVDGVLDASAAATGLISTNTAELWINGNSEYPEDRFFDGEIDDVRVYDYGLSAAEITDLAAMGALIPVVDAGVDQTFLFSTQNNYLQLDATVTDDGDPSVATLEWTKTSGPDDVDFSNTAIEDPCAIFSTTGTYILRLTADDTIAQIYDEVTIEVENPTCLDVIDDGLLIMGDISGPDGTPDCYINLHDFATFASYWLKCNNPQDSECEFPY